MAGCPAGAMIGIASARVTTPSVSTRASMVSFDTRYLLEWRVIDLTQSAYGRNVSPASASCDEASAKVWRNGVNGPKRRLGSVSLGKFPEVAGCKGCMAHILVVEDEAQIANPVRDQLTAAGHEVTVVGDGALALRRLESHQADLVILDWMLPGLDGLEVCRRIRARSITPILMLTARAAELDRVLGLEVGADDYLTKPFSMAELLARARALLRRVDLMSQRGGDRESSKDVMRVDSLTIDIAGRTAQLAGQPLDLTPKEFDLLRLLGEQPGRAYSREYLLQRIWGDEYVGFDRTVDTHVVRLRKKLGSMGDRIATVWGIGYKLRMD